MNPSFFHQEHGRLMSANLERDAARRHEASKGRRKPRESKVRFQLRFARARAV